jgi:hypothetical protein
MGSHPRRLARVPHSRCEDRSYAAQVYCSNTSMCLLEGNDGSASRLKSWIGSQV